MFKFVSNLSSVKKGWLQVALGVLTGTNGGEFVLNPDLEKPAALKIMEKIGDPDEVISEVSHALPEKPVHGHATKDPLNTIYEMKEYKPLILKDAHPDLQAMLEKRAHMVNRTNRTMEGVQKVFPNVAGDARVGDSRKLGRLMTTIRKAGYREEKFTKHIIERVMNEPHLTHGDSKLQSMVLDHMKGGIKELGVISHHTDVVDTGLSKLGKTLGKSAEKMGQAVYKHGSFFESKFVKSVSSAVGKMAHKVHI
jgi:hypothetical protein